MSINDGTERELRSESSERDPRRTDHEPHCMAVGSRFSHPCRTSIGSAGAYGGQAYGRRRALLGLCGSATTINNGLIVTEVMVKPVPGQQAALAELKAIAKQNTDALATACMGAYSGTLPERLAASERRLEVALAGLRKLKPAAEKFYAMLSDEQKREANGVIIFP